MAVYGTLGTPFITARQNRAIAALLTTPTAKEAAEVAGVGERSIRRWLTDPLFMAALQRAEGELVRAAIRDLVIDQALNLRVIRDIRDKQGAPPAIKLRAAIALDQSLLRWREAVDFESRLAALEQAVNNGKRT